MQLLTKISLKYFLTNTFVVVVSLAFLFSGCASFSGKVLKRSNKSTENNINKFKGVYSNAPQTYYPENGKPVNPIKRKFTTLRYFLFNNKMSLDSTANYYIEVIPVNQAQMFFAFKKEDITIDSITIGGSLRNGMFYLDNKLFRCHGIPYFLGGCERKKFRLATSNNELIAQETYDNSGAFLFFFWAGTSHNFAYSYARKKD